MRRERKKLKRKEKRWKRKRKKIMRKSRQSWKKDNNKKPKRKRYSKKIRNLLNNHNHSLLRSKLQRKEKIWEMKMILLQSLSKRELMQGE
jgi:hypothetical protein